MVAEGVKQKRWLQGDKDRKSGCSRRETKTEKVVAVGGRQRQKRWLRQRSLGRQIQRERRKRKEKIRTTVGEWLAEESGGRGDFLWGGLRLPREKLIERVKA